MKYTLLLTIILTATLSTYAQRDAEPIPEESPDLSAISNYLNSPSHAAKKKPVTIPGSDSAVTIDGDVEDAEWATAAKFKDFVQTEPGYNIAPSKKTEAFLKYDAKNLYIAFKCWDDPEGIRATVAKRDRIFSDDNVRVYLDTYGDKQRAYLLGWNPLGIQADGMLVEGQNADFSIDIVMESKGKIHDWGWSVEVKIPFKSLRYEAGEGKSWGFNATRSILRLNNEFNSWMPQDRNIQGFLVQNGEITGLTGIDEEQTLEVIPSVTFSETGRRVAANENPDGRFINEPIKTQVGVNIKYNITPNITFDAAVNPDFAEVEADAAVVTANQRFPIFFPEKRPFFLEGAETFQSPLFLFNSRTIIDPDVAAKLTGKSGKNSFGFLVASDNAPGNYDEDTLNDPAQRQLVDEFVERNATFAVARVKRDFGVGNNIGFFGTARVFPENRNFVAWCRWCCPSDSNHDLGFPRCCDNEPSVCV